MIYHTTKNNFPKMVFLKQRALRKYGKTAVERSLEVARAKIIPLTPVVTSRLVNSIQGRPQVRGDSIKDVQVNTANGIMITGVLGSNVPYAARVEFGFNGTDSLGRKYNQKGQFFFSQGFSAATEDIKRVTKATLMGK